MCLSVCPSLSIRQAFETFGIDIPPLHYHLRNRIPYARGLGSSSAAIVAGILAGEETSCNAAAANPLDVPSAVASAVPEVPCGPRAAL